MSSLTPPPNKPQRGVRATFANQLDAFIAWLINFVTEMAALVSGLNVLASGAAYSIPYTVDLSSTADADPTSGKLRFNTATQNAASTIYLDLLGSDGVDYTSILDQLDASTSSVKGQIRIVKQGDPTKFLTFDVTARTTVTGYRKLSLANTGGSSANPFATTDPVLIKFTRSGDKGDKGDSGFSNMVVLTSTQNWTAPAGVAKAKITAQGGGAGGSGGRTDVSVGGSSGFAGGISVAVVSGLTGKTLQCTIGSGGAGGPATASGGFNGGAGGATSATIVGGATVASAAGGGGPGGAPTGGSGSTGDLLLTSAGNATELNPYGTGGLGGQPSVAGLVGKAGVIIIEY
jgi:hypothetical protein